MGRAPRDPLTAWHEDDELWAELLPVLSDGELGKAAAEAAHAAALLRLKPGARVLDLGCGPGRHSLDLARLVAVGCKPIQ